MMGLDWLFASIDPSRPHALTDAVAWHGRLMWLSWAAMFPLGILIARFYKITRKQKWPEQVDSHVWWYTHLGLQHAGIVVMLAALWLILQTSERMGGNHATLGWSVIALCGVQFLGGWLRGSKGGPTEPAADGSLAGDHYDMTRRRRIFEAVHKSVGYAAVLLAAVTILNGLWLVNAPRWMCIVLAAWWLLLTVVAVVLQRRGFTIGSYQAIWGPDPKHPGNAPGSRKFR
jgi:hypothetical protein